MVVFPISRLCWLGLVTLYLCTGAEGKDSPLQWTVEAQSFREAWSQTSGSTQERHAGGPVKVRKPRRSAEKKCRIYRAGKGLRDLGNMEIYCDILWFIVFSQTLRDCTSQYMTLQAKFVGAFQDERAAREQRPLCSCGNQCVQEKRSRGCDKRWKAHPLRNVLMFANISKA